MSDKYNELVAKNLKSSENDDGMSKAYSDLIEQLGEEESLKLFSDLNINEIRHLSVLMTTGDDLIQEFSQNYIGLKVSHRRRGRKELIDLSEAFGKAKEALKQSGIASKVKNLF